MMHKKNPWKWGVVAALVAGLAVAQDGAVYRNGDWSEVGLSKEASPFERGIAPSDGGVLTVRSAAGITDNDCMGVTLGGIVVESRNSEYKLRKNEFELTDNAFIAVPCGATPDSRTCFVSLLAPFSGDASTVLSVYGGAPLLLGSTYSGIGAFKFSESAVTVTNTAPAFLSGDVSLDSAGLYYAPGGKGGSVQTALGAGSKIAYGNGGSELGVAKGNRDAVQVTVKALERQEGGLLTLVPGSGAAALGSTEKIKVADADGVSQVNGVVDASVTVRDFSVSGWPRTFASYDSDNGFAAYEPVKSLADATPSDVAKVDSDTELAASKAVNGVRIDGGAGLTVPEGKTLAVGDGEHVAAVIVNGAASSDNDQQQELSGGGEIAFGSSEGVVYGAAGGKNCSISVSPKLSGTAGLTFAGQTSLQGETLTFSLPAGYAAAWSGPTRVTDAILSCGGNPFPPGGHVYALDGPFYGGAQLRFSQDAAFDQTFHLRGTGPHGTAGHGVLYANGKRLTFRSPVVIEDGDVWIGSNNRGAYDFMAPIRGDGSLKFYRATATAYVTNEFSGDIVIGESASLNIVSNGTMHAGAITCDSSGGELVFRHLTHERLAVTNSIDLSVGCVRVVNSSLALLGSTKIGVLEADQAEVAVGANVAVGALTDDTDGNAVVSAATAASTFTVGSSADSAIDLLLDDGDGKLGLVKTGSGTVTLSRQQSYTGDTVVKSGTLKLMPGLLGGTDVLYWLDASDAGTYDVDGSGHVTSWRSKNGNGYAFAPATYPTSGTVTDTRPGPVVNRTLNGLPVMSFSSEQGNRLMGGNAVCQRTVFIVNVPMDNSGLGGIFGPPEDAGVRLEGGTQYKDAEGYANFWTWSSSRTDKHGACFDQGPYVNGKAVNRFVNRSPQILAFTLSKNLYPNGWTAGYRPYLGGYYPWREDGVYGARNFNGDIAEVIAFNRALSTAERNAVEKYLADKWGVTLAVEPQGNVEDFANVLNPATSLVLEDVGTLDLNGANETVASLSGQGIVRNSSSRPATLRVTGACDFSGRIEGKVTLVTEGDGNRELSLSVDATAALAVAGGTAHVGTYAYRPTTEGLGLWLDASRSETIVTNASGRVTQWKSLAGRYPEGMNAAVKPNDWTTWDKPSRYSPTGFDGKPGVFFGEKEGILNRSVCQRSVYIAFYRDGDAGYLWGTPGIDNGLRSSGGKLQAYSLGFLGASVNYVLDGVKQTTTYPADKAAHCLSLRIDDEVANSYVGSIDGLASLGFCLGRNTYNSNVFMWVGEVLVYERRLTDEEDRLVREYLTSKWVTSPAGKLGVLTQVFSEGAGFAVGEGARVDLTDAGKVKLSSLGCGDAGGRIAGDVELDGEFSFDANGEDNVSPLVVEGDLTLGPAASAKVLRYGRLRKGTPWPVLTAGKSKSGEFRSVEWDGSGSKKWALEPMTSGWQLYCNPGFMMFIR